MGGKAILKFFTIAIFLFYLGNAIPKEAYKHHYRFQR